jgi:trehalose synthase
MTEVSMGVQDLQRFEQIVGGAHLAELTNAAASLRRRLEGRIVWNINSTAAGGGVAELLQALLPYARGAGIDVRWLVMQAGPEFFQMTKRLHHALHGSPGDGSPLDDKARSVYEAVMPDNAADFTSVIQPRDIVLLHDPQTAGLAPYLIAAGARVIWRCHIGDDHASPEVEGGWAFLAPYLKDVPAFVFSRAAYVPEYCDHGKSTIVTPSIDAFSPKNQELGAAAVRSILVNAGLVEGPPGDGTPTFLCEDGSPGRVNRAADVVRLGRAPMWDTPLIVQISRWDPLKDPSGVMHGFAKLHEEGHSRGAELVLAGPNVTAVADDPEGAQVFARVLTEWRDLPHSVRGAVHLVSLPMTDVQENAAIVNALQRHATIIVQKSLQEGFGLTVTEAMWKSRPLVASAVGGIQDQIRHEKEGLLLDNPADLPAFAAALQRLLDDPALAHRLGANAHQRVEKEFLGLHSLAKYAELIERVDRQAESS